MKAVKMVTNTNSYTYRTSNVNWLFSFSYSNLSLLHVDGMNLCRKE